MPSLELVSHALCPYVQRAVIALTEKGVPFKRTVIDLASKPAWFTDLSPLGKVPLLKVDGAVLFESAVICDYLDETIEPRLHPADPLERAHHRAWVEFASTVLGDIWRLYTAADPSSYQARLDDLRGRFRHLETVLGAGPWFGGAHFSLVDAAFGPLFRYFDVFESFANVEVFDGLPKVSAWRRALALRPSIRSAVAEDYPERLRGFVVAQNGHMARLASQDLQPV